MKKTVTVELTKEQQRMVLDGLDILSPDGVAREKLRAALWDKINLAPDTVKPEVFVVVENGLCSEVHANQPIEVTVLDFDDGRPGENDENDKTLKEFVNRAGVRRVD